MPADEMTGRAEGRHDQALQRLKEHEGDPDR
jgi:hypothetical protein